jgi:hypothetical protein
MSPVRRSQIFMPSITHNHVDLRPLLTDPAAAETLLLARGQLNRAYRMHGLAPPDPLPLGDPGFDPMELDDPAALGLERAMERFRDTFIIWAGGMPLTLVGPVMDILRLTHQALGQQNDTNCAGIIAVLKAYEFLLGRSAADRSLTDSA